MKILVAILTCSSTQTRADACLATWIKDIKSPHDYFFYGNKTQSEKMPKTWNCEPDKGECRNGLTEKTYKMLVKSLDYEWDFLFKCDDDTYVCFDRLIEFLKTYDPSQDLYIGKQLGQKGYAQGGAGYVLTRSAVKKCIESLKHFYRNRSKIEGIYGIKQAAEDYYVGLALKEQEINLTPTFSLSWGPPPAVVKENQSVCIDEIIKKNKITTHYVLPETMETIYELINT